MPNKLSEKRPVLYVHTCLLLLISMLWHMQAIFGSTGGNLFSSAECRIRTRVSGTESPADGMPADKPTDLAANGQAITNIVHSVFEFRFNTTQHKTILYTSL